MNLVCNCRNSRIIIVINLYAYNLYNMRIYICIIYLYLQFIMKIRSGEYYNLIVIKNMIFFFLLNDIQR